MSVAETTYPGQCLCGAVMKDGLPKLEDFPVELGGTGEAMAE